MPLAFIGFFAFLMALFPSIQNQPQNPFIIAHPLHTTSLLDRPQGNKIATINLKTEFGQPKTLSVLAQRGSYLKVLDPASYNRPAWVKASGFRLTYTRVAIVITLHNHKLQVIFNKKAKRQFAIGIGAPDTSTPTGRYFITDKLPGARFSTSYGCCILALSGHQPRLPRGWTGGDRLAIHGTNIPASIGASTSTGCLHASTNSLHYLLLNIPLGTPVFIRA